MKPIVALIKSYRGGEWFDAVLESVSQQCVGVVAVSSDAPWKAVAGKSFLPENCREPLLRFQRKHPEVKVVLHRMPRRQDTQDQYQVGMKLIQSTFGPDVGVLLLDTDEVWDNEDLLTLRKAMTEDKNSLCFRSGIWTYLRSPLWRVTPQEPARVVVGLSRPGLPTGHARLADIYSLYPRDKIADVPCSFHHFGYVRNDPAEITSKLANSTSQDRVPTTVNWKEVVWDNLPSGRNIHPQKGFESCWGGVEQLDISLHAPTTYTSDAFWAGLLWDSPGRRVDLFLSSGPNWRNMVETMPPVDCPVTTVSPSLLPAIERLVEVLGGTLPDARIDWLLPRLRMSFRETVQLAMLARTVPAGGNVLEIGSGLGGSMATMLLACPVNTTFTAVDPYLPYDEQNVILDKNVTEGSTKEFQTTVLQTQTVIGSRRVNLCRESSINAVQEVEPDSLDLLLIDGNHSYTYCKDDLNVWWDKVKTGGLLLVHDYATRFPGVIQAVKEFEAERGVSFSLPTRSTLVWLRK